MNITEHEMRGLLTGKCIPGDMRVNEELAAYLVRRFSEQQQKLDAVVAENARMLEDYRDIPEMRRIGAPLTPATDTYLNPVRADGIEMYCAEVLQNNMRIAAEAGKSNAYRIFSHLTAEAMEFAAQLRTAAPKGDSDEVRP